MTIRVDEHEEGQSAILSRRDDRRGGRFGDRGDRGGDRGDRGGDRGDRGGDRDRRPRRDESSDEKKAAE
jgi:small subunit ribosomal protein S6